MDVSARFTFSDFCAELMSLQRVAKTFLRRDAEQIVKRLVQQLEQIQSEGGGREHRFTLDEDEPLRSLTESKFEGLGRKATFPVFGSASWVWDITPVTRKKGKPKQFDVTGIASTRIRIFRADEDSPQEIAMWRVELGDLQSPGAYFHAQILGETDTPPFPRSMCVPRMPSLFVTPMSAVEFMLGELFQDAWGQHATGDRDEIKYWNQIQRRHLNKLLEWKMSQLSANQSSPWVALKRAKPRSDESLFFEGKR